MIPDITWELGTSPGCTLALITIHFFLELKKDAGFSTKLKIFLS